MEEAPGKAGRTGEQFGAQSLGSQGQGTNPGLASDSHVALGIPLTPRASVSSLLTWSRHSVYDAVML